MEKEFQHLNFDDLTSITFTQHKEKNLTNIGFWNSNFNKARVLAFFILLSIILLSSNYAKSSLYKTSIDNNIDNNIDIPKIYLSNINPYKPQSKNFSYKFSNIHSQQITSNDIKFINNLFL